MEGNDKPYFHAAPYGDLCECVTVISAEEDGSEDPNHVWNIATCGDRRIAQVECPLCDGTGVNPEKYF